MLRKFINTLLFFPFFLYFPSIKSLASEPKDYIDDVLEENEEQIDINRTEIKNIILENNPELKSLEKLVSSATFNLSSKISKRYPSMNIQSTGLPKYVFGKNFNSNSIDTKTSQVSANPSLNIRWDLIDPLRGPEVKIAKNNLKIAKNNYEIKKRDLILEANSRFHKLQKSYQEVNNQKISVDLSLTSLKDAQSKFDIGIGTKFEVLEADAQLARDKQFLREKKISLKINEISLKEILNTEGNIRINQKQNLIGFWNYNLNKNIKNGLTKNLSIKNIQLQKAIKNNQAENFINSNKPKIYINNTISSSFSKGDSLALSIDPNKSSSSYSNTISLNFSWNIFNAGQNKNSYKSKKAEFSAEDYSYKNLKNIVKTNITEAYLNLRLNQEKIISSEIEILSTNESLRLSRLRYDAGISTLKDILIRQKELSNARTKNIDAIYSYNLNLDKLERLTFLEISNKCISNNIGKKKQPRSICDY